MCQDLIIRHGCFCVCQYVAGSVWVSQAHLKAEKEGLLLLAGLCGLTPAAFGQDGATALASSGRVEVLGSHPEGQAEPISNLCLPRQTAKDVEDSLCFGVPIPNKYFVALTTKLLRSQYQFCYHFLNKKELSSE